MAKKGGSSVFSRDFDSFLSLSRRAIGFCWLSIICILCLGLVHFRSLIRDNSGGPSCRATKLVFAAAAGSHDDTEGPQKERERVGTPDTRAYLTRTGRTATEIALSSASMSEGTRTARGTERTTQGPPSMYITSPISGSLQSTSNAQEAREESTSKRDPPTGSGPRSVSHSRQRALAPLGTKKETAEKVLTASSSGSYLPWLRSSSRRETRRFMSAAPSSNPEGGSRSSAAKGDENVQGPQKEGGEQEQTHEGKEERDTGGTGEEMHEEGQKEGGSCEQEEEREVEAPREGKQEGPEVEEKGTIEQKEGAEQERLHARAEKSGLVKRMTPKGRVKVEGRSEKLGCEPAPLPRLAHESTGKTTEETSTMPQSDGGDDDCTDEDVESLERGAQDKEGRRASASDEKKVVREPADAGETTVLPPRDNRVERQQQQQDTQAVRTSVTAFRRHIRKEIVTDVDNNEMGEEGKIGRRATRASAEDKKGEQRERSSPSTTLIPAISPRRGESTAIKTRSVCAEALKISEKEETPMTPQGKDSLAHVEPPSSVAEEGSATTSAASGAIPVSEKKKRLFAEVPPSKKGKAKKARLKAAQPAAAQPTREGLAEAESKEETKSQVPDIATQQTEVVGQRHQSGDSQENDKITKEVKVKPAETGGLGDEASTSAKGSAIHTSARETQEEGKRSIERFPERRRTRFGTRLGQSSGRQSRDPAEENTSLEEMQVEPSETRGLAGGPFTLAVGSEKDNSESQSEAGDGLSAGEFPDRGQLRSASGPGQPSGPADENTATTRAARRTSTRQDEQQRKKAVPQRKIRGAAQETHKIGQPGRTIENPASWMKPAVRDWRNEVLTRHRTKRVFPRRARAPSTPSKVERALELLGRQLRRRQASSDLHNFLQRRLSARFRHHKPLQVLWERTGGQFQLPPIRTPAPVQPVRSPSGEEQHQPSSPLRHQASSSPQSQGLPNAAPPPSRTQQIPTFPSILPTITVDGVSTTAGDQGEQTSTASGEVPSSAQQPPSQPQTSQTGEEAGEEQHHQDFGSAVEGRDQRWQLGMDLLQVLMAVFTQQDFTSSPFGTSPSGSPLLSSSGVQQSIPPEDSSPLSTPHGVIPALLAQVEAALTASAPQPKTVGLAATSTSTAANVSSSGVGSQSKQRFAASDDSTSPDLQSPQQGQQDAALHVGTERPQHHMVVEGREEYRAEGSENASQEDDAVFREFWNEAFVEDDADLSPPVLSDEFLDFFNAPFEGMSPKSSVEEVLIASGESSEGAATSIEPLEQPGASGVSSRTPHPGRGQPVAAVAPELQLLNDLQAGASVAYVSHLLRLHSALHGVGPSSASAPFLQASVHQPSLLNHDSATDPQPLSQQQLEPCCGADELRPSPTAVRGLLQQSSSEPEGASSQSTPPQPTSAIAQLRAPLERFQRAMAASLEAPGPPSFESGTQSKSTTSASQTSHASAPLGPVPRPSNRARKPESLRWPSQVLRTMLLQAATLLLMHEVLTQASYVTGGEQLDRNGAWGGSAALQVPSYTQQGFAPPSSQGSYAQAFGVPSTGAAGVSAAASYLGAYAVPQAPSSVSQPPFSSQQVTSQLQAPMSQQVLPQQATPQAQQYLLLPQMATHQAEGLTSQQFSLPQQVTLQGQVLRPQRFVLPQQPTTQGQSSTPHIVLLSQQPTTQGESSTPQVVLLSQQPTTQGESSTPQVVLLSQQPTPQGQATSPQLFLLSQDETSQAPAPASQFLLIPQQATPHAQDSPPQQVSFQQDASQAQGSTSQQDLSTRDAASVSDLPTTSSETPLESPCGSVGDGHGNCQDERANIGHASARRLQEREGEESWKRGDEQNTISLPLLENEVIKAGFPVLQHGNADLGGSPLATAEGNAEEERVLNRIDGGLTEREMLLKSLACFRTVKRHFTSYRAKYVSLVDSQAPNLGMREDEVLRLLFHAAWVTCYSNVKKQQLQQLVHDRMDSKEELLLLRRTAKTPTRFSRKQHSLTEEVIRRFAREYPADDAKVNGTLGIIYSALIITCLFVCLLVLHRFYRSRRSCGSTDGKAETVDTPENSRFELSPCVNHS